MLKRLIGILLLAFVAFQTSPALAGHTGKGGYIKKILNCTADSDGKSRFLVLLRRPDGTELWIQVYDSDNPSLHDNVSLATAAFLSGKYVYIGYYEETVSRCYADVVGRMRTGNAMNRIIVSQD